MEQAYEFAPAGITALGFVFIAFMSILLLIVPRRFALIPLLFSICWMTLGQQVVIAGLHFPAIRIILIVGWIRVFADKRNPRICVQCHR